MERGGESINGRIFWFSTSHCPATSSEASTSGCHGSAESDLKVSTKSCSHTRSLRENDVFEWGLDTNCILKCELKTQSSHNLFDAHVFRSQLHSCKAHLFSQVRFSFTHCYCYFLIHDVERGIGSYHSTKR